MSDQAVKQGMNGASVRHFARGAVAGGLGGGMPLDSENVTTVSTKLFLNGLSQMSQIASIMNRR